MTLQNLNAELKDAVQTDSDSFLARYLEHEKTVLDHVNNFGGLQTEIYLHNDKNEFEMIKFAALFSDFLSIYTASNSTSRYHITCFDERSRFYLPERTITIPPSLTSSILSSLSLIPGYIHPSSEDARNLFEKYAPLLESSKSIIRPVRALLVAEQSGIPSYYGSIYYAQGNTSTEQWVIKDSFSLESLPINNYITSIESKRLFSLTLPYLKGTDIDRFVKIILDETDLLSGLRKELKQIIRNFNENENKLEEIKQEVLRPEVDKINRFFRHYKNQHKMRIAGSVGLFTLALIKVIVPEAAINEFVSSVIGSSGFTGIFVSEKIYQEEMNKLRDNPFFLLWKLERNPSL